jgi:hypothetical protein
VALTELALAHIVDAGLLVELHRQLDQIQETCDRFVEMVENDDREGIDAEEAWTYDCWATVGRLTRNLIDKGEEYRKWAEMGTELGEWICELRYTSVPPSLPALDRLRASNDRKVLQERLDHLTAFAKELWDASAGCYGVDDYTYGSAWIEQLTGFDQAVLEVLSAGVGPQPLVVIDEKRSVLEFLGMPFDFSAFREGKAAGGWKCFRVLAEVPMTQITYGEIIERAGIAVDEHRLAEYFSGFRDVVQPAIEKVLPETKPTERQLTKIAFIKASPMNERLNKPGSYQLAIPRTRVRTIRAT